MDLGTTTVVVALMVEKFLQGFAKRLRERGGRGRGRPAARAQGCCAPNLLPAYIKRGRSHWDVVHCALAASISLHPPLLLQLLGEALQEFLHHIHHQAVVLRDLSSHFFLSCGIKEKKSTSS